MIKIFEATAWVVMLCPVAALWAQDVKRSPVPDSVLHVGEADARGMMTLRAGAEPVLAVAEQAAPGIPAVWADFCDGPIAPAEAHEIPAGGRVVGVLTPSGVIGQRTGIEERAPHWLARRDEYRRWRDLASSFDALHFVARFDAALDEAGAPKVEPVMHAPAPRSKNEDHVGVLMVLRLNLLSFAHSPAAHDVRQAMLAYLDYEVRQLETCVKAVQP